MFKLIKSQSEISEGKSLGEMEPCEIGRVINGCYKGCIVMRTASIDKFEVMNLSHPGVDSCWTNTRLGVGIRVIPLEKGEKLTLEVV